MDNYRVREVLLCLWYSDPLVSHDCIVIVDYFDVQSSDGGVHFFFNGIEKYCIILRG